MTPSSVRLVPHYPQMSKTARTFSIGLLLPLAGVSVATVWWITRQAHGWPNDRAPFNERPTDAYSPDSRPLMKPEVVLRTTALYGRGTPDRLALIGAPIDGRPTTWVQYVSRSHGISIDLPHNPHWGTKHYRVAAYEEGDQSLIFGRLAVCEGGGLCRSEALLFLPPQPSMAVEAALRRNCEGSSASTCPQFMHTKKLGSLTVVVYEFLGDCGIRLQIIGKKNNYELRSCYSDWFEGLGYLEKIATSAKLID